jgi:signal transduction histidine kinase
VKLLQCIAAVVLLFAVQAVAVPASADEFGTKAEAVALVKRAIARVAEVGIDKAAVEFMDHHGSFIDRDLYLAVVDKAGIRVAHGQNAKLVGKSLYEAVDVKGKEYGKQVEQIIEGPGQGWVSFMYKDPVTGKILPKEMYVERAGNYSYMTGVYLR